MIYADLVRKFVWQIFTGDFCRMENLIENRNKHNYVDDRCLGSLNCRAADESSRVV